MTCMHDESLRTNVETQLRDGNFPEYFVALTQTLMDDGKLTDDVLSRLLVLLTSQRDLIRHYENS